MPVPAAEGVPAARQGAGAERRGRAQVSARKIPRECVAAHETRPRCRQTQQHPRMALRDHGAGGLAL
eukprot:scaffold105336_cov66-Phaeocystis_antarctica.AAC.5